ncbi:peptidoglycan editing factor PgeF [Candidatus Kapaibacterium sp.]
MIEILKPEIFQKYNVESGVTLRNILNFPPYGFSISKADIWSDDEIESNRCLLSEQINIKRRNFGFQKQTHSDIIRYINSDNNVIFESDGIYTNEKGFFLSVSIADCAAVLIYDHVKQVVTAVHSGWRGTQQGIVPKALTELSKVYGSKPENLIVYISPAAGGENYEVGYDVAQYFPNSSRQISHNRYLYDNKNEIILQLTECGVLSRNIEKSEICTIQDLNFHSFRRDGKYSGRMSAFIGITG